MVVVYASFLGRINIINYMYWHVIRHSHVATMHMETEHMVAVGPVVVGVLCIQGAFIEHIRKLEQIRDQDKTFLQIREVRLPQDLDGLDGFIIPGGESTTLSVFLSRNGFDQAIKEWIAKGNVVWGTCAGLILLSDQVCGQKQGGQIQVSISVL